MPLTYFQIIVVVLWIVGGGYMLTAWVANGMSNIVDEQQAQEAKQVAEMKAILRRHHASH